MPNSELDWSAFEGELHAELVRALTRLARSNRTTEFYALALYGVYRELDRTLTLPLLAAASVDTGAPADALGFWGARWNPPDWEFSEIDLRKRPTLRLERVLTTEATRGSQAHFRRVEARYFRVLTRLAKRLRDEAPSLLRVSADFVAFVFDAEGGPELAAKSIPKRRFEALFAAQIEHRAAEHELAALEPATRAAYLVTRFDKFEGISTEDAQRELLTLGASAVPALLEVVSDAKVGWTAAKLLGQIGHVSPDVTRALRDRAPSSFWHAMALGVLGDQDWLAAQPPKVAVPGLCAPFRAITKANVALDYAPLERYLDRAEPAIRKQVEDELAPGSSYNTITKIDVAEALRGLASEHAVIRWHAANLLGDRGLGPAAGKAALPALAEALRDPHPIVRRLAVLAISYWKAAAKPYWTQIEALREDRNATVRTIVAHVLATPPR
jgi:hypothetical protein